MVEPGIEPGTSWLVDRSSDHQATRLVYVSQNVRNNIFHHGDELDKGAYDKDSLFREP